MLVIVALGLAACALFESWQERYLKKAVNHATKTDVVQRMGPPQGTRRVDHGNLLLYRFNEYQAGDLNGPGRWWCEAYALEFDQDEVLRRWDSSAC